jgi:protein TonB
MAMSAAYAIRDDLTLKKTFVYSVILHVILTASMLVSAFLVRHGDEWGGPGGGQGSVTVKLVGSLAGIPLPTPAVVTPSRVVDTTKGLYKEEPRKPEPPTDATKLPKFTREKPPKTISPPSRVLENPTPPPENAVPYGQGGRPNLPYSSFSVAGGSQGSLGMSAQGGGDFGARYSWYVQAVQGRISQNWNQFTVDSAVRVAPRAVLTFEILRDGTIRGIRVTQSSGNSSVDNSAVRAVQGSSPLTPLPSDYSGSGVNVEFYFDFHR